MNRLFIRGRNEKHLNHEMIRIGVIGLGQSVGTTFVAMSLAFFFGEKEKNVTYIECINPYEANTLIYDSVAMDRRFANRKFESVYEAMAKQKNIRKILNFENGINWLIAKPSDCCEDFLISEEERARLVGNAKGDICIFDIGSFDSWSKYLVDMDYIFAVVDPQPSKLIKHSNKFKYIKQIEIAENNVKWIVNKANKGISMRQIKSYLKTNDIIIFPMIDSELLYADEYACRFHWENKEIRCNLCDIFNLGLKTCQNIV